jgi:hypothetical protein
MVIRTIAAAVAALLLGCSGPAKTTAPDFGVTIPCNTSSDCPPSSPVCHPMAKVCIGCLSGMGTCVDPNQVCDDTTHTCVPAQPNMPCHYDSECSGKTVRCNKTTGQCVECLINGDCAPETPYCDSAFDGGVSYQCKDGCFQCRGAFPLCSRDMELCCAPADAGLGCFNPAM